MVAFFKRRYTTVRTLVILTTTRSGNKLYVLSGLRVIKKYNISHGKHLIWRVTKHYDNQEKQLLTDTDLWE